MVAAADEATRHHLREYLATDGRAIHWDMIRAASASVADTAIHPLQDVMGLDSSGRMNFPARAKAGGPGASAGSSCRPTLPRTAAAHGRAGRTSSRAETGAVTFIASGTNRRGGLPRHAALAPPLKEILSQTLTTSTAATLALALGAALTLAAAPARGPERRPGTWTRRSVSAWR